MRAFRLPHLLACGLLTLLASAAQAGPIDIDDGQHKVHLPDTPKRVVVLEFSFLDGLASVGVTPVAPQMMATPVVCCQRCARPWVTGNRWGCARNPTSK